MLRLKQNQFGTSHMVAVLAILAIGVIGAVALRISSAHRLPYQGYTFPIISRPTSTSAVCSSNGIIIVPPAGQSCTINQDANGVHCYINGSPTTCPTSSGTNTYTSTPGTPGTSTSTTNTTTINGSSGSGGSSTCSANGHGITGANCSITSDSSGTHCYLSGVPEPCQY